MGTNKKREILVRAYLGFAFIFLLGMAIIGRAFYIQTYQGKYYRSLADSLTIFPKTVLAERGNIYSDDGRLLASTLPKYDIRIDFKTTYLYPDTFKKYVREFAELMSKKFPDKTKQQYIVEFNKQRKKKNRSYLLARNVSFNDLNEMKQWPLFNKGPYVSGIREFREDKRLNPFELLAKRTLGAMNDSFGISGLEKKYDSLLRGKEGTVMVQKISGGVTIPIDSKEEIASQPGKDVYTTINIELQDVAEDALMRALQHHAADHGCVVLMEVSTGKIKALANLGLIKDSTYGEIQNYAVGEVAYPGSVFKIATVASMMEDGIVTNETMVPMGDGSLKLHPKLPAIFDHKRPPEAPELSVKRAIEISSNVAVAYLADKYYNVSKEKFYGHLEEFGFTKPIAIELPGAAKPVTRLPKNWSGVSAAYLAHGYEWQITPLHMLMFYNAIANNGKMVQPHLVEKIKEYNTTVDSTSTIVLNEKICSEKTIQQLKEILEGVVENGTAQNLKAEDFHVAGKTGTAVIGKSKADSTYGKKIYQASFCGYFPKENPQYSMIVVINSPTQNGYYGNEVAGTIFKEVADKVYSLNLNLHDAINAQVAQQNNLPEINKGYTEDIKSIYAFLGNKLNTTNTEWSSVSSDGKRIFVEEIDFITQTVPDVTGMSLKDALFLLESLGIKVSVIGKGNVVKQSVAGETIVKGMSVTIELK